MVYVPLLIAIIAWPMVPGAFLVRSSLLPSQIRLRTAIAELEKLNAEKTYLELLRTGNATILDGGRVRLPSDNDPVIAQLQREIHDLMTQGFRPAITSLLIVGGAIIVWWVVLAIAGRRMTETIRAVFAPYSPLFVRRGMLGIASVTFLVALLLLA